MEANDFWRNNLNNQQSGCPDPAKPEPHVEVEFTPVAFEPHELVGLTWLRDHYYEQPEQLEINAQNNRLRFIRWLVEHDRLSDQV